MKKVLITGAGGFIGGHLAARLLKENYKVICCDIKPLKYWFQNFKTAPIRNDLEREYGLKTPRVIQDVRNPGHCNVVVQAPNADTFNKFWNDNKLGSFESFI